MHPPLRPLSVLRPPGRVFLPEPRRLSHHHRRGRRSLFRADPGSSDPPRARETRSDGPVPDTGGRPPPGQCRVQGGDGGRRGGLQRVGMWGGGGGRGYGSSGGGGETTVVDGLAVLWWRNLAACLVGRWKTVGEAQLTR